MEKVTSKDLERTLPFGQYRDKTLEEVPIYYLRWLQRQSWFLDQYTDLSNAVERVLEDRQRWGEKW